MPSFRETNRRNRQRGFSLLEVMFASMILSIFVLGIGGFWYQASSHTTELVLRQKAIFALSGELERLSALYVYTGFAADAVNGPITSTGYTDGLAALPTTRLVYPHNTSSFASNDFVQNAYGSITSHEFPVYEVTNILPSLIRDYIWIDQAHGIAGRVSWTATDISVSSCVQLLDCSCQRFDDLSLTGGRCRQLDIYLEYPYRIDTSGNVTQPGNLQTLSLRTIVGRG